MLVVGMVAQIAGTIAANAPLFLIPYLYLEQGLTLTQAGLIAATPAIAIRRARMSPSRSELPEQTWASVPGAARSASSR